MLQAQGRLYNIQLARALNLDNGWSAKNHINPLAEPAFQNGP